MARLMRMTVTGNVSSTAVRYAASDWRPLLECFEDLLQEILEPLEGSFATYQQNFPFDFVVRSFFPEI